MDRETLEIVCQCTCVPYTQCLKEQGWSEECPREEFMVMMRKSRELLELGEDSGGH